MSRADWSEAWWREQSAKRERFRAGIGNVEPVKAPVVRLQHAPRDRLPDAFQALCVAEGLPKPIPEFLFHPVRKWRFDYAFLVNRVAVEVEGGIWRGDRGAHGRPLNILRDMEKYNASVLLGWRLLRTTPDALHECVRDLKILLAG